MAENSRNEQKQKLNLSEDQKRILSELLELPLDYTPQSLDIHEDFIREWNRRRKSADST